MEPIAAVPSARVVRLALVVVALAFLRAAGKGRARCRLSHWLEGLWPKAQSMGVSRKTFSAAIHGLEPDLKLPDLELPGRKGAPPRGQAEFVQTPADYVREGTIANGLPRAARNSPPSTARTLAAHRAEIRRAART